MNDQTDSTKQFKESLILTGNSFYYRNDVEHVFVYVLFWFEWHMNNLFKALPSYKGTYNI